MYKRSFFRKLDHAKCSKLYSLKGIKGLNVESIVSFLCVFIVLYRGKKVLDISFNIMQKAFKGKAHIFRPFSSLHMHKQTAVR
jgi:hypothetical protein